MPTKAKKKKGDAYHPPAKSVNWGTPHRIRPQYRIEDGWADPRPYQHTADGLLSEWPPAADAVSRVHEGREEHR